MKAMILAAGLGTRLRPPPGVITTSDAAPRLAETAAGTSIG